GECGPIGVRNVNMKCGSRRGGLLSDLWAILGPSLARAKHRQVSPPREPPHASGTTCRHNLTVWARRGSLHWLYLLLEHCWDRLPAGSLSPNSQSTLSPCAVRQRSLPTLRCLGPPLSALHLAIHQELRGARQCFLACISYKDSLTANYRCSKQPPTSLW